MSSVCLDHPRGPSAVVAGEPFASVVEDPAWREESPELAVIADEENSRVARALRRLQREH